MGVFMPERIRLTEKEMKYMALFQDVTGASVRDCIIDEENNRIIFLVKPGEVGLAIGKGGINIKRLRRLLDKDIEVVEYAEKLEELAANALMPARVKGVKLVKTSNGRRIVYVTVDPKDKGIAIGKGGRNVSKARLILKRYFDVDTVVIV